MKPFHVIVLSGGLGFPSGAFSFPSQGTIVSGAMSSPNWSLSDSQGPLNLTAANPSLPRFMVGAPQYENMLAPDLWEEKWDYILQVIDLPGVNDITLSVMNVDGLKLGPGYGVNILTATVEEKAEWKLFFNVTDELGIHKTVYGREGEHNRGEEWWMTHPLSAEDSVAVARETAILFQGNFYSYVIGEEYADTEELAFAIARVVRSVDPAVRLMIHIPNQDPSKSQCIEVAKSLRAADLLDVLLYQTYGDGDAAIYDMEKTVSTLGIPYVAHEYYGGMDPRDTVTFANWATAQGAIGFSVYTDWDAGKGQKCEDQECPNPSIFAPCYEAFQDYRREAVRGNMLGGWAGAPVWQDVNGDGVVDSGDLIGIQEK